MKSPSSILDALLSEISEVDRIRVWSMIISVFGDAVVPRGGRIALSSLNEILGGMDIGQNAVRTAMSRLAKDGWVVRHRIGRQSYYELAPEGYKLFESASRRIYDLGNADWSGRFELVLRPDDDHKTRPQTQKQMRQLGFGSPMQDVYVRPEGRDTGVTLDDRASIVVESAKIHDVTLEEFVRRCWQTDELSGYYERLISQFSPIFESLDKGIQLSDLNSLILRVLLVHEWRKLALRNVDLPDAFRPDHDPAVRARVLVGALYKMLLRPSESFLDHCESSPGSLLPPAHQMVFERFAL